MTAISEFSTMMSTTQGCEMRFALILYLMRNIQMGKIKPHLCSSHSIPNLNEFLLQVCNNCIDGRINKYFKAYYDE